MRMVREAVNRVILTLLFMCFLLFTTTIKGMIPIAYAVPLDNHQDLQERKPFNVTIVLEREYLDGEVSEEVINETEWSMGNLWAKYDQWRLINMDDTSMVFRKKMNDISPLLKANGYFGVTEDGVLTIFNGRPGQSRIIQSFFQIDIKKLESKKQEELYHGIPIKTKDRYVEVLETLKHYSKKE